MISTVHYIHGMSDNIGFLVSDVARLLRRRFDERARSIGVTRPQWRVLTVLSRCEGINQVALADLLEVEPITLCRMVDRLQEAKLVERRPDPSDRRAWQLHLTEASRPMIDELRDVAQTMFEEVMLGLGEAARTELGGSLDLIRSNLLRLGDGDGRAHANG